MSKLSTDARLPQSDDVRALKQRLYELQRDTAGQVNALSEGAIRACSNAAEAPPATGIYTAGDFVRNSAPQELGTAGSKYVVEGWTCLAAPTTFVQKGIECCA
jgi:hypothetical protein